MNFDDDQPTKFPALILREDDPYIKSIPEFLNELTLLSRRYGLVIDGCGCCGSPYLISFSYKKPDGHYHISDNDENLSWVENEQ